MTEEDREPNPRLQSKPPNILQSWPPQRQRRSHHKSRNGCQRCKRRRIKCDEVKPICGNCSRLSIPCDFNPASGNEAAEPASQLVIRRRGRPRKDWGAISFMPPAVPPVSTAITTIPLSLTSSTLPELGVEQPSHLPWTVEDLELLYHYQSHTSLTLGDTPLWRDRVPRLAFRNHCVLHLMLALSALHLLRIKPHDSRRFEQKAEAHFALGLRQAMAMLPSLNEQNATALYISTVLICSCTFAKKPSGSHLLVIAEGDEVAWWELFRGVRIVVETIGIEAVFAGELGPLPPETPVTPYIAYHIDFKFVDWEEAVGGLSELIPLAPELSKEACQKMLSNLLWCFKETYGTSANPKSRIEGQFERIMLWLYCLSDEMAISLKNKEPVPLVLLAYFTVLLQLLERIWYMQGWAAHVLKGITDILDPKYSHWLQWPNDQIQEGMKCVEASKSKGESQFGPEDFTIVKRC